MGEGFFKSINKINTNNSIVKFIKVVRLSKMSDARGPSVKTIYLRKVSKTKSKNNKN